MILVLTSCTPSIKISNRQILAKDDIYDSRVNLHIQNNTQTPEAKMIAHLAVAIPLVNKKIAKRITNQNNCDHRISIIITKAKITSASTRASIGDFAGPDSMNADITIKKCNSNKELLKFKVEASSSVIQDVTGVAAVGGTGTEHITSLTRAFGDGIIKEIQAFSR